MKSIKISSDRTRTGLMLKLAILFFFLIPISCSPEHSDKTDNSEQTDQEDNNSEPTPSMLVALSFDDGPNNHTTPKVLDILEEHNVPASFFVIGQNINDSTAEQMKRAISLGCEIQNHSFTHSYMTKLSAAEVQDELKRTDDLVEKYTGTRPWLFRPPYIDQNKTMHDAVEHTFISGIGCRDWEAKESLLNLIVDLFIQM